MTRLQVVVQHDDRRAELLPRLLRHLPGARVVTAERGSCWRTYLACLRALEKGASHLLIVQDDAVPCPDFLPTVEKVIAARPEAIIALFVSGSKLGGAQEVLDACSRGSNWALLAKNNFVPVVCTAYPRADVEALTAYADANPFSERRTSDDANVYQWMQAAKREAWATVPSLCDHNDFVPSLIGTMHSKGRNPVRRAACWTGEDWSPSQIDWAT